MSPIQNQAVLNQGTGSEGLGAVLEGIRNKGDNIPRRTSPEQIAYEAYCGSVNWKSFTGDALPQWPDVRPSLQAAWQAAAMAVLLEFGKLDPVPDSNNRDRPNHDPLNPVAETKQFRKDLDAILQRIKTSNRKSRERSLAFTELQMVIMWLGMDLKEQNEANPYPESYNPASPKIEPTADGLKL